MQPLCPLCLCGYQISPPQRHRGHRGCTEKTALGILPSKVRYSRRIFLWLLLALFCAPLVIHVYLGSYSRFIADDFCSSAVARSQGIFRGSLFWYLNWNGRYSANLLDSLFGYIGPAATPFATGLVVTAWLIVLAIAVRQLKRDAQNWIIAAMVLFAVLRSRLLVTCWGYIAGQLCRSLFADRIPAVATAVSLIILFAFGILAVSVSREMWKQRSLFTGYARRWDERDQMIQRAKSQGLPYAVVLRQHNWAALDEIAVDPKITWLTKCVHDYYGINVIPDLGDLYGEPDGPAKQAALERQFESIQKMPGSIPTELNQIYKTDRGKIGFYKTDQSPEQIKSYYDNELGRLGWKYIGEKKVEAFQSTAAARSFCFAMVKSPPFCLPPSKTKRDSATPIRLR